MARIYILFAGEPVFHPKILRDLVRARSEQIVGVGEVGHRRRKEDRLHYLRSQLGFWGVRGFLVNALAVVWRRALDRLPVPTSVKGFRSLRSVCEEHRIPFEVVENVNDPAYLDSMRRRNIDVIVSSQGQIFGRELLDLPNVACINRHSALLPAYGGIKPVFWAMLNGEREVGVSVHIMEEEVDRGQVLAQIRVPVTREKTLYETYRAVFELSTRAILHALEVLEGAARPPVIEPTSVGSYFGEPQPSDIRRFRELGYRMV